MGSVFSARSLSLAAVCLQSTALAIVLHVSQAQLRPGQTHYKASSAVLLTELGKLVLSLLLAMRDTFKERATLLAPRHTLPSPELYSGTTELGVDDPTRKDPYDTSPSGDSPDRPLLRYQYRPSLRRRSSVRCTPSFSVTIDERPGSNPVSPLRAQFPERSTLAKFQWPHKPISPAIAEKLGKISPEGTPQPDPRVIQMLDDPRLWLRRRRMGVVRMLWEDVFGGDWWKMAVPAVLFALQNNLIYVAARNLSVPVFQITFQLKTVITAITAVVMLGRRLTKVQWATLISLGFGVATMQLGAIHARAKEHGAHPATESNESMNYLAGVTAVLISCFSSAIAATYFELVIKRQPVVPPLEEVMLVAPPTIKPASLWVRNIQLSLFSSVIGLGVVLLQASHIHLDAVSGLSLEYKGLFDPLEHWYDPVVRAGEGFFEGFSGNHWAWMVIFLQTVGGLLIAVAIKHADNIAKGFALSISIVFTFLLSVIFFNFELSAPSVLGAAVVVASTLLFEAGAKDLRGLFGVYPYGAKKPTFRRWHYLLFVALATTLGIAAFPARQLSYTSAAWELVQSKLDRHIDRPPSVAIADMSQINEELLKAAGPGGCGWGVWPQRETTKSAYGPSHPARADFPYYVTNTNQFALDDILATRFATYSHTIPMASTSQSEFIFVPLLSQIWSNPWGCPLPELQAGIEHTTQYLRDLAAAIGPTPYPRIIVPITTIRSILEHILTPELMAELKDSIVLVSIENAPQHHPEGLKYLIDVPYPTAFHLSSEQTGAKPGVGGTFLRSERPYLLHYAGGATHPWGQPASDPFNGFSLRGALLKEFSEYLEARPENATAEILFDNITNSVDGAQNLTLFHEHMAQARFCPMPAGDSPSRRAFYEALQLGCIPVIFRDRSYGRLFPSAPEINDFSKYTVFVDETDYIAGIGPSLIERLEAIPASDVRSMQEHIARIAHKLQWSIPDGPEQWLPPSSSNGKLPSDVPVWHRATATAEGKASQPPQVDAFHMLLKELARLRDGEWTPGIARDLRRGVTSKAFGRPLRR